MCDGSQAPEQKLEQKEMRAKERENTVRCSRRMIRRAVPAVCVLAVSLFSSLAFAGQQHGNGGGHPAPPPHMNAPHPSPQFHSPQQMRSMPSYRPDQQHLPEWLNRHQNLTPSQREDALRREPGFNRLPQQQQQRYINRMHSLNSLPPQERQRTLQRNELFEHMNPEQKAGVRGASQAFHQMPPERQSQMRRAFQDLRGVPPEQRQYILNSSRFQQQFSPQERTVLGNLLAVEPYQGGPPR